MYDYSYEYSYGNTMDPTESLEIIEGILAFAGIISVISMILGLIMIISLWKIFTKARKPGWASIIPIYNFITLLQVVELPAWYILLFFVPIANIYAMFKIYINLAHKFGKSTGFGILTIFFGIICLPILAFGKNNIYNGNNNNLQNSNSMDTLNNNQFTNSNNMVNNYSNPLMQQNNEPMFNQNVNTEIHPITQKPGTPIIPGAQVQQTVNPEVNIQMINNQANAQPISTSPQPFVYNPNPTVPEMNTVPMNNVPNMEQPINPMVNTPSVNPTPVQMPQQPVQSPNPFGNPNNTQM